ncbi:STAS domain-containing protein [Streptomyces sp. NPDC101118]|uniref:STAS domain-containing protein n=1 Tax=Streptomyces sp. NPDC101118 TaxID=3366109 RepID=UPI0038135078
MADTVRAPVVLDSPPHAAGVVVCRLIGEIDIDCRAEVRQSFSQAVARATEALVVDCGRLEFCDSTLLNALIQLHRQAQARELGLALAAPPAQLLRLLTLTGTGNLLPTHRTVAHALHAVDGKPRGARVTADLVTSADGRPAPRTHPAAPSRPAALPRTERTGPSAYVTVPGTEIAAPGRDVTAPGTEGAAPGRHVTVPGADGAVPGTQATDPGADGAAPGTHAATPTPHQGAPESHPTTPGAHRTTSGAHEPAPATHPATPATHERDVLEQALREAERGVRATTSWNLTEGDREVLRALLAELDASAAEPHDRTRLAEACAATAIAARQVRGLLGRLLGDCAAALRPALHPQAAPVTAPQAATALRRIRALVARTLC